MLKTGHAKKLFSRWYFSLNARSSRSPRFVGVSISRFDAADSRCWKVPLPRNRFQHRQHTKEKVLEKPWVFSITFFGVFWCPKKWFFFEKKSKGSAIKRKKPVWSGGGDAGSPLLNTQLSFKFPDHLETWKELIYSFYKGEFVLQELIRSGWILHTTTLICYSH